MMCLLSFAVVLAVTTARPADATAQPDPEPAPRSVQVLAAPNDRIAFGVRRSTIQHLVTTSPFDDVYATPLEQPDRVTLVTVHRFGQRAATPWNLSERVRIAFGGRGQSTPIIYAGLERPTAAVGSLTIEFGDRR
jgi:hypothetical protein